MLIMANFCLVSSFFLSRPPLLLPCLTLPPPWLYTPIHATLYGPPPPLLTPLFFLHSVQFTNRFKPPRIEPRPIVSTQCRRTFTY